MSDKKNYFVGVCYPFGIFRMMWDVAENKDYLSPDLLARKGDIELPLLRIEAKNQNEAVKIYKERVPAVRKWRLIRGWL